MMSERFNIILNAAEVKILYISFPKPACDALPITKPCLQNCSGGSSRTLEAPEIEIKQMNIWHSKLYMSWNKQ